MLDTLKAMSKVAHAGKKDLEVRRLVEKICEGLAEGDYAGEVLAINYWVKQHIRYMRDPDGVEFLKTPRKLLETRAGDCDDIATLLAAMLMAAGNSVAFTIASFAPGPPAFSHVYVEVATPHGAIVIDPVANRDTRKMLHDITVKASFPLNRAPGTMDAGVGDLPHVTKDGGKIYSVFDYNRGMYDYYKGPAGTIPATGRFRKPRRALRFGVVPEDIAAPLPFSAQKIGTGKEPRGLIAARGFSGVSLVDAPWKKAAVGGAAGLLLWGLWRRTR
jgi:predicted transglutaminase-like cysteine proteinase